MKKLFISALLISASILSFAKGNEKKVKLISDFNSGSVAVLYTEKSAANVLVKISDQDGKLIQTDRIKSKEGFHRPYDVSKLDKGLYTVEVLENGDLIHESSLLIDNSKSAVRNLGHDRFQLTFAEKGCQRVAVGIMDSQGNLVHKESVNTTDGFSKVYDLSRLSGEHFTFEVTSMNTVEMHKI